MLLRNKYSAKDFQLKAALHIAEGEDTILIAPTGSGKTLVLAMPLLYHDKKTSLVLSPLHALETDQVDKMNDMGVPSLLIDTVDLPGSQMQVCIHAYAYYLSQHGGHCLSALDTV